MVNDTISRAMALEVLKSMMNLAGRQGGKVLCGKLYAQIKDLPVADAMPVVHGKWEKSDTGLWQHCSVCGVAVEVESMYMCKASEDENFNFCPHCGAKMDGKRREADV